MKLLALALPFLAIGGSCSTPSDSLPPNTRIDSLVVNKSDRSMTAYANGKLVRTYIIALGRSPEGDKQVQGDMRTPEGLYTIDSKNPNSGYHKNLGVSYPTAEDRKEAKALGKSPGGDIKVHGLPNGKGHIGKLHRLNDWTYGCIAVTDEEVDELYGAVEIGSPILIKP